VLEPATLKDGVIAARTLVDAADLRSLVRVINVTHRPFIIRKDNSLGEAHHAEVCASLPEVDMLSEAQRSLGEDQGHVRTAGPVEGKDRSPEVPEYLQCLIDSLPPELNEEQKGAAKKLLLKNADVLSKSEYDLGCTPLLEHSIETNEKGPVREGLRRHPVAYLPKIDEHVEQMLEHNIIRPMPGSEWISNFVLVRKNDGNLRYCVDYKGLNAVTQKANYPLPRIDASLESLGGNRLFSSLDMRSSHYQVRVKEEDVEKTSFVTRKRIFAFNVLPFGLCNVPSTFQRLVELAFAGLTWEVCLTYIDDLVCFSKTFVEHLERFGLIFDRLR